MPDDAQKKPAEKLRYHRRMIDRHGKERHYFRRRGAALIVLPDRPGTAKFMKAYQAALAGSPLPPAKKDWAIKGLEGSANGSPPAIGVYLLLLDGQIVYIGSSLKMQRRVADHRAAGRPFDQVFYIGTKLTERLALEGALIAAIAPPQNRR